MINKQILTNLNDLVLSFMTTAFQSIGTLHRLRLRKSAFHGLNEFRRIMGRDFYAFHGLSSFVF